MNWYEIIVSYDKTLENGQVKKVKEAYLQQASSVTEAENCIIQEVAPMLRGEFEITRVIKRKVEEFFFCGGEAENWIKARVAISTITDKGDEKKRNCDMYIQDKDIYHAIDTLYDGMRETVDDWELVSISETNIEHVYWIEAKK